MGQKTIESKLSKLIGYGSFFITIFVVSESVTDPVNVTKFLSLGVIAGAITGVLVYLKMKRSLPVNKHFMWFSALFLIASLNSSFQSSSPLVQNFYGSYGRNNGFFTYLFLIAVMIGASVMRERKNFLRVVNGLILAGIVNMAYCLWVIAFGDFIGWTNPYGNILGTFGNPNFIGSFLGIFFSIIVAIGMSNSFPNWLRISVIPILVLIGFVIIDSSAIQGRILAALGTGLVVFFYIRSRFNLFIQLIYSILVIILGILGIAGALQKGPFVELVYKTSVSLRGQYWLAGWNTGQMNPIFGSGMDSFGDWYRRARDIRAIELPGVNTVVNTAHNVPLDMFAFGGWPLFLAYLSIMCFGAWAILKLLLRSRNYDFIAISLTVAWVCYQVQSFISINQIGLAIWGWCLTGALVGYERTTRDSQVKKETPQESTKVIMKKGVNESASLAILAAVFSLIGFLIALPPLAADSKWRKAQTSATVEAVEASMKSGLFNPQNSMKYQTNIQILEQSGFHDLAHKYALEATEWNPEAYDLWRLLYLVKNSSSAERALAVKNMKRLDPLNPDVTAAS